jgi:hypothetical protein
VPIVRWRVAGANPYDLEVHRAVDSAGLRSRPGRGRGGAAQRRLKDLDAVVGFVRDVEVSCRVECQVLGRREPSRLGASASPRRQPFSIRTEYVNLVALVVGDIDSATVIDDDADRSDELPLAGAEPTDRSQVGAVEIEALHPPP